jgi:small GTP-binding protein
MTVVMIGNPNVGKSLVLNRLTGSNFIVSNYAGTSLELSEATLKLSNREIKIIDTPGIYSIISSGQDQRIIKDLLEKEKPELILNVLDATNMERNLLLSFELKQLGFPMVILLNQIDRAPFSMPLEELDFLGEGLQELRLLNWMESRVAVVEIELLGTVNNQEEEMEAIYELLSDLFTFNKKADSNIIYVYSKHLTIY